jgi:hypothetical protein
LGLLHELPANTEKLAQPSQEIGFHLLPAMATNFQVLPPLWQPAINTPKLMSPPRGIPSTMLSTVFFYLRTM